MAPTDQTTAQQPLEQLRQVIEQLEQHWDTSNSAEAGANIREQSRALIEQGMRKVLAPTLAQQVQFNAALVQSIYWLEAHLAPLVDWQQSAQSHLNALQAQVDSLKQENQRLRDIIHALNGRAADTASIVTELLASKASMDTSV